LISYVPEEPLADIIADSTRDADANRTAAGVSRLIGRAFIWEILLL
jgi:hypothetical protein